MNADACSDVDVVVVGGGLAGLAAATFAARRGLRTAVIEKSSVVGGRARTTDTRGFRFNLGPHALYRRGAARHVLRELGIEPSGVRPGPSGWYAVHRGVLHTFPTGFVSMLTTGLLRLGAKVEVARALSSLSRLETDTLQGTALANWMDGVVRDATARDFLHALVRLSTYTHDPTRMSAGAALAQLRLSLHGGVLYLHHGWSAIVDALTHVARAAGVHVMTGSSVIALHRGATLDAVRLDDGCVVRTRAAVIAASPRTVVDLLASIDTPWPEAWPTLTPVRLASLDLGLSHLGHPRATFALGIDQPTYYSVHSIAADLAPAGGATVHVAKYLEPDVASGSANEERELEHLLDRVQPGWQRVVAVRRYLPALTVTHASVTAGMGGVRGRPTGRVPGVPGLYVVGDWVGDVGLLSDASLSSARAIASLVARDVVSRSASPSAGVEPLEQRA